MAAKRDYTILWVALVLVAIGLAFQFWPSEKPLVDVDASAVPTTPTVARSAASEANQTTVPLGDPAHAIIRIADAGDFDSASWPGQGSMVHVGCGDTWLVVVATCFDVPAAAATDAGGEAPPAATTLQGVSLEVTPIGPSGDLRTAKTVTYDTTTMEPVTTGVATAKAYPQLGKSGAAYSDLPYGRRLYVRVTPADLGAIRFMPGTRVRIRVLRHEAEADGPVARVPVALKAADADGYLTILMGERAPTPHAETTAEPTETPQVTVVPPKGKLADDAPYLPQLRLADGEPFAERTDIRLWVHGKRLHGHALAHDANPEAMVTTWTDDDGPVHPFYDDSLEFYLMANDKSPLYYQLVVSNTGVYRVHKVENLGASALPIHPWAPASLEVSVTRDDSGYTVDWSIELAELEIAPKAKDFQLQVARNYRGQGEDDSRLLHLFPGAVYGDTRSPTNSHDRRAFQKARLVPQKK